MSQSNVSPLSTAHYVEDACFAVLQFTSDVNGWMRVLLFETYWAHVMCATCVLLGIVYVLTAPSPPIIPHVIGATTSDPAGRAIGSPLGAGRRETQAANPYAHVRVKEEKAE
jgi:hypothetical protein